MGIISYYCSDKYFSSVNMNSHTKHEKEFHLERAQGHAIRLWNDHHIPCGFFFIDPKFRKPVIYASENIKLKLEKYFDEDPDLMKAFDDDAETMNLDYSDKDYHPQTSKKTFNRIRANLNPSRLPFPLKYCNYEELREYLGIELLQHHNRGRTDGVIKKRFLYGHPEYKPSFWPNRWPWPTVTRLSKKYSGPGEAVDMFRLLVRLLLQESDINPDEYFDQNCDKKILESRKKAAEKLHQTQQSWLDQSSSEDAPTPPQQSSPRAALTPPQQSSPRPALTPPQHASPTGALDLTKKRTGGPSSDEALDLTQQRRPLHQASPSGAPISSQQTTSDHQMFGQSSSSEALGLSQETSDQSSPRLTQQRLDQPCSLSNHPITSPQQTPERQDTPFWDLNLSQVSSLSSVRSLPDIDTSQRSTLPSSISDTAVQHQGGAVSDQTKDRTTTASTTSRPPYQTHPPHIFLRTRSRGLPAPVSPPPLPPPQQQPIQGFRFKFRRINKS